MAILMLELPPQKAQTADNLSRWAELLADRTLARFEGRIETDRHGRIIMSPPPLPIHGSYQARIAALLEQHLSTGRVMTECPISTADGVKATDVAWASPDCLKEVGQQICFTRAPEICVEVISPSNTKAEMNEKMALYFDAGAKEVWLCQVSGAMNFFNKPARPIQSSRLCPAFPKEVKLR